MKLSLKPQEISFDHPDSSNFFQPSPAKPFLATPAAIDAVGLPAIVDCLRTLQSLAIEHRGLDYLQVFEGATDAKALWFIDGGEGGAITALLPSDY